MVKLHKKKRARCGRSGRTEGKGLYEHDNADHCDSDFQHAECRIGKEPERRTTETTEQLSAESFRISGGSCIWDFLAGC